MDRLGTGRKLFFHIVLIIGSFIMAVPFIWMILTSIKTNAEATTIPPKIFPAVAQWKNYIEVFQKLPFIGNYMTTIVTNSAKTDRQLLLCTKSYIAIAII